MTQRHEKTKSSQFLPAGVFRTPLHNFVWWVALARVNYLAFLFFLFQLGWSVSLVRLDLLCPFRLFSSSTEAGRFNQMQKQLQHCLFMF